ncbi:MAG: hypothetical protein FJX23_06765 [Alphaproteobacteria bacterium]|nr:hypothetical protein [Alphaproteobacteria bacterium]
MNDRTTAENTPKGLTDSQVDVAEYAVTGLSIVINQAKEKSPAIELASELREDLRGIRDSRQPNDSFSEQGWNRLQALSSRIGQDVPSAQANNLLVEMAGVASALSTAGLVKAPEREVQVEATRETTKPIVGRWTRQTRSPEQPSAPSRGV